MAFGIGSILGAISSVVSPIASIAGAIGQIISPSRPPPPQGRTVFLPAPVAAPIQPSGGLMLPVGLPFGSFRFGSQVGPSVQPAAAGALVPFVAGGARSLIAALLARASAAVGTRITRNRALSLVRDLGLAAAAAALGLTAIEIAQIIASSPRRRRRGITAAQIATTKATIRRMDSLNRQIAAVCPPTRRRRAPARRGRVHPAIDV